MHAVSHSLAHRGPGASRARSRWQPYTALNPTCSTQHCSPLSYLHTPASSVLSVSPSTHISPVWNIDPTRKPAPIPFAAQPLQPQPNPVREAQKNKCVTRLVDQAVKSLCDIWHPENVPQEFRACPQDNAAATPACEKKIPSGEIPLMQLPLRNTQLPSPRSPSTQASPFCSPPLPHQTSSPGGCIQGDHLMPIRGFVHEVLRRSRTSTGVLQTALCYLEAVRSKVPGILQQENLKASQPEAFATESAERIILASALEQADADAESSRTCETESGISTMSGTSTATLVDVYMQEPLTAPPTELITNDADPVVPPPVAHTTSKKPSAPLPPLPPSPSPLLCPRRTFLACLILASKFMQDRSYSNKAWAKLAGLPAREIGRCERALGEALEWRLWVGKGPSTSSGALSSSLHRSVARCRSEIVATRNPTCFFPTPTTPAPLFTAQCPTARTCPRGTSNLRRAATMPSLEATPGDGFPCTDAGLAFFEHSDVAMEATLVAEPDMDDFAGAPTLSALAAPARQAALYAGDASSPSLSTPGLAYSPMSTTSSDDGDRAALAACRPSAPPTEAAGTKPFAGDFATWATGAAAYPGSRFAALEPFVVDPPARLPPPSEAVSNPVLLESSVSDLPELLGSFGHGHVGPAHFYPTSHNWSVSDFQH
ncbi:hypothetical protein PsYK624_083700 [Phanerochaete sordida]|uniref:Cyclin N-terminal domain-containing protein n=1 Tax=Phanerochaete sordida TaxID=48140 RepID=A0A9P3LFP1_9APHY|nr:hypothetical protein PsYK624_083700 [Phanerochaete sordida]